MQYYNARMNRERDNKNRPDARAVCLNRVVSCCVENARAVYPCQVEFLDCDEVLLGAEPFDDIADRTAQPLDRLCRESRALTVRLSKLDAACAHMEILGEDRNVLAEVRYALFQGIPDSVISDPDRERALESRVKEIFAVISALADTKPSSQG